MQTATGSEVVDELELLLSSENEGAKNVAAQRHDRQHQQQRQRGRNPGRLSRARGRSTTTGGAAPAATGAQATISLPNLRQLSVTAGETDGDGDGDGDDEDDDASFQHGVEDLMGQIRTELYNARVRREEGREKNLDPIRRVGNTSTWLRESSQQEIDPVRLAKRAARPATGGAGGGLPAVRLRTPPQMLLRRDVMSTASRIISNDESPTTGFAALLAKRRGQAAPKAATI